MLTFLCLVVMMVCYLNGVLIYCSKRKHLLIICWVWNMWFYLLFWLIYWLGMLQFELFLSMIYLVFGVCEGSLGLGILVSTVRSHRNDFQSFVVLHC